MFFLPQPAVGVVAAGPSVVALDAWGQQTVQQPVQIVEVMPQFVAAGINIAGFAQGVAGLALGGGAVWGGNNADNSRRTRRQRRQAPAREEESKEAAGVDEEFQDCEPPEAFDDMNNDYLSPCHATAQAQVNEEMRSLMEQLEMDGESQKVAIDSIRGLVPDLAFDPAGCRVVQRALEVASQREAADLASKLTGNIRTAIDSKYANYVVQKIVEVLPPSMTTFMAEELLGAGGEAARHRYGCRIICRLLEHSATERGTYALINELLMEAKDLSRHAYGYHVIRCILEHGLPEHRRRVANTLCGGLQRSAKHRHASFVVEKALAFCEEHARDGLTKELLASPENIADLARHQYGRHVVSQLVRLPGDCSQHTIDSIRLMRPQVRSTKHGRRLLEELRSHLEVSVDA